MEKRSQILIVDDDPAFLDMAEEVTGGCFDVTLALSGAQALEILRQGAAPELIILDIDMPEMDGYETIRRIREIPCFSETPVIFLSGLTDSDSELAGLSLGAQDYITKPFVKENLLARINLRLESGRLIMQLQKMREAIHENETGEMRFAEATKVLTPTELSITRLIAKGYSNQEIARKLHYSLGYVKNRATLIYEKLNVEGRSGLRVLLP